MLFKGDPARLGHPLHLETSGVQGECILKIRCYIYLTLIPYHYSSWTCAATHIQSHNTTPVQDIVAADALASESEANGEPFPIHKLPTPPSEEGSHWQRCPNMIHLCCPSYGPNRQRYNWIKRIIAKWIVVDCLPYRTVEMRTFRAMTRSLHAKFPDFSKKSDNLLVAHCLEYCSVLPAIFNIFFITEIANVYTRKWKLRGVEIEK